MSLEVFTVPVRGVFLTYCYVVADRESRRCLVADPGAEGSRVLQILGSEGLTIDGIILTHGHFDHIGGVEAIVQGTGCPVYAYRGTRYLTDPVLNLSRRFGRDITVDDHVPVDDMQDLPGLWSAIKVIHTPGHTPDSVIYYDREDGFAIVGDTVFRGADGNPNYPGGDVLQLNDSLEARVFKLPPETVLLPGHSGPTTVAAESKRHERERHVRSRGIW